MCLIGDVNSNHIQIMTEKFIICREIIELI